MATKNIFEGYPIELLNRSTSNLKSNDFYVKFLNFSDNLSNILGRQVYSISPPNIKNQTIERKRGDSTANHAGQFEIENINIKFRSDAFGIINDVILRQFLRQNGLLENEDQENKNYRFDIQLELLTPYNNNNQVILYKNCFLEGFNIPEMSYKNDEPVIIDTVFQTDEIDIQLKDWLS